jgi:hypothetical protein
MGRMNDWKGLPENVLIFAYESFVYKITDKITGKYYIGKKNFWKVIKMKPLKGNKNKRHKRVESDWKTYFGSSQALLDDIEKYGEDRFEREILILCNKKCIASYFELYLQMDSGVLFDEKSYNNIINVRLNGNIFINNIGECKRILQDLKR